jgi:tryptophan-rich sensory protein
MRSFKCLIGIEFGMLLHCYYKVHYWYQVVSAALIGYLLHQTVKKLWTDIFCQLRGLMIGIPVLE